MGQLAEVSLLVPDGAASSLHESPPLVVFMMVEPDPLFPLLPTPTQSSNVEQAMLVISTALLGGDWLVHSAPVFDVPSRYPVELSLVPPAMHEAPFAQAIAAKLEPTGIELVALQSVKLVVPIDVAFPPGCSPTATHVVRTAQDREVNEAMLGV